MIGLISFMLLALVLGFKHSYDPDHLIGVSNILRKADSIKSSAKIGIIWAIGHMITATIITITLFIFKESFLNSVLPHFEKIIGIMLIILGLISLKEIFNFHFHHHEHDGIFHSHPHAHIKSDNENKHSHAHMFGIGIMHGLASNDELFILFTSSLAITSLGGLLVGLGLFSVGVVFGMIFFAMIFSFPLIKLNSDKIYKIVALGTGSIGVIYGALILSSVI